MREPEQIPTAGKDSLSSEETGQQAGATQSPAHRRRVLVVDDDPVYLELLSENLTDIGFDVIAYTDSVAAMSWLMDDGCCDAILMDWYMPGIPGRVFLKRIRDAGLMQPVIVLTGAHDEDIEDTALGSGAIDFVDKSRRFSVLLKRLDIIVGKLKGDEDATSREGFSTGPLWLDPKSCRAHWQGQEAGLTITEFRIVYKLARKPGVDFTYREIYDVVHGEGFHAGDGTDGVRVNVRSLIKRIRRKFRAIDDTFESIENYPGHGYRWQAASIGERHLWRQRDDRAPGEEPAAPFSACDAA